MANKAKFTFFNVGQGDATLLELPSGQFMLIDNKGGGKIDVRKYLKTILPKKDDKYFLNYFMLTHAHADHVGSVNELFDEFEIGEIWYTGFEFKKKEEKDLPKQYKEFLKKIKEREKAYSDKDIAVEKDVLTFDVGDVKFEFLSPPTRDVWDNLKKSEDVKAYLQALEKTLEKGSDKSLSDLIHIGSIICRISYMGSSVLITGDSELLAWKYWVMPRFSSSCFSKLLHAPHHGSKGFFISQVESGKDEAFNENTNGCYTNGLLSIAPSIVVVTNKTKPGAKDHESPPNEYALKLYSSFKNAKRTIKFTSDGSIQYVIPDDQISTLSIDSDKRFTVDSAEKTSTTFEKPRSPAVLFPNRFG